MLLKDNYPEFQKEIATRGIKYLIHFTPTINLWSIMEHGKLLCRETLESLNIEETDVLDYAEFTDEVRFDDKRYINLSISFPNTFLFSRFIQKTSSEPHIVWTVLKIDPKYIYHRNTLFSITNAANSHNKRTYGITGDIAKFRMMFSPNFNVVSFTSSRMVTRGQLAPQYPTDVQAEVLVRDEIPFSDVIQVCFKNHADLAASKAALSNFDTSNFCVDEQFFTNLRI